MIPQDFWDQRVLAYCSSVYYCRQLSEGSKWGDLKRVIGINILGGGKEDRRHWPRVKDFKRHYIFRDDAGHTVNGIELIQYSIMNPPPVTSTRSMIDWLCFLTKAHKMTQQDVTNKIETDDVKKAFRRAEMTSLPLDVEQAYITQDHTFEQYSQHTQSLLDEALPKGVFPKKKWARAG